MDTPPAVPAVTAALDQFEAACAAVATAIAAVPDARARFAAATCFGDRLAEHAQTAATARAVVAEGIRAAESLSFAGLADRLNISRARAAQLVNRGRRPAQRRTKAAA